MTSTSTETVPRQVLEAAERAALHVQLEGAIRGEEQRNERAKGVMRVRTMEMVLWCERRGPGFK